MAIDATSPRPRRAVLMGAFGGVAAWALTALGRPPQAEAASYVVLGGDNTAAVPTRISDSSSAANAVAFVGRNDGGKNGVVGLSMSHAADAAPMLGGETGVYGYSDIDIESNGVWGFTVQGVGVHGTSEYISVYGETDGGTGVKGQSQSSIGVDGYSYQNVGVLAETTKGVALKTIGRVQLTRVSGVAVIPSGANHITVTPGVDILRGSFALLTPHSDIGTRRLWYTLDAAANTLTIHLSSIARPAAIAVSWLLLG